MTQENFEKYLALLKGLLKLRDSQKEEIASELRDHLEQRVEELEASGLDSDEAELAAIKEFGDAAGMASSFVNISRFRKQRWMMRFTTFAIAGCFVAAVFIMSMWPQNGPVQINSAEAQTDSPANVAESKAGASPKDILGSVSKIRNEREEAAYAVLDANVPEVFADETPLSEVLSELSKGIDVSILVSKTFLEDSGNSLDDPVTLQIKDAKLTTVLEMIFRDQLEIDDWAYGIKDSFIYISSKENARELMEVRVYDCIDFAVTATYKVPVQNMGGVVGGLGGGSFGGSMGGGGIGGGGQGGGLFNMVPSRIAQGLGGQLGGGGAGGSSQPKPEIIQGGTKKVQTGSNNTQSKTDTNPTAGYKTFETEDLSELIDCIQVTIDPENWENMGGVATLSQVGTAIVVNQTIENHRKIEELLVMLRKIKSLKK